MSTSLAPKPSDELQRIVDSAGRELDQIPHTPFSDNAFERLKYKVSEYTAQLVTESVKFSRRHSSETVSSSDVERASQYLVSSTSHKVYRHMGTLGGLVLGTGAANGLSILTTAQFTPIGLVITFTLILIGAFMVAFHIAKE
jgi:histone H3/H4